MNVFQVFIANAISQAHLVRAHPQFLIGSIVQPMAFMMVVLNVRDVTDPAEVARYAIAVLLISYWGTTVWQGAAILQRERNNGTLKTILRGVKHPMVVITGKAFGATLSPAIVASATLAVILALHRVPVYIASGWWFAVGIVMVMVSGTMLGTLLCSVFLLTRHGNHISSALLYPVYLLSGLLIPVTFWPSYIGWLSSPVSLRWASDFLDGAVIGRVDPTPLLICLGLTIGYGLIGYTAFRSVLKHIMAKGTMDVG